MYKFIVVKRKPPNSSVAHLPGLVLVWAQDASKARCCTSRKFTHSPLPYFQANQDYRYKFLHEIFTTHDLSTTQKMCMNSTQWDRYWSIFAQVHMKASGDSIKKAPAIPFTRIYNLINQNYVWNVTLAAGCIKCITSFHTVMGLLCYTYFENCSFCSQTCNWQ